MSDSSRPALAIPRNRTIGLSRAEDYFEALQIIDEQTLGYDDLVYPMNAAEIAVMNCVLRAPAEVEAWQLRTAVAKTHPEQQLRRCTSAAIYRIMTFGDFPILTANRYHEYTFNKDVRFYRGQIDKDNFRNMQEKVIEDVLDVVRDNPRTETVARESIGAFRNLFNHNARSSYELFNSIRKQDIPADVALFNGLGMAIESLGGVKKIAAADLHEAMEKDGKAARALIQIGAYQKIIASLINSQLLDNTAIMLLGLRYDVPAVLIGQDLTTSVNGKTVAYPEVHRQYRSLQYGALLKKNEETFRKHADARWVPLSGSVLGIDREDVLKSYTRAIKLLSMPPQPPKTPSKIGRPLGSKNKPKVQEPSQPSNEPEELAPAAEQVLAAPPPHVSENNRN